MNCMTSMKQKTAFTLIELLVVVAIIAVLAAIAVPVLANSGQSARRASEAAAARSLSAAMQMHASDNNGSILPGYVTAKGVTGSQGEALSGEKAKRYPWRLASYLGGDTKNSFLASGQKIGDEADLTYLISLVPSFGMNTRFVGGDESQSPHPFNRRLAEFFVQQGGVTRMAQVLRPSQLITFVSASYDGSMGGERQPGFFKIDYPDRNVDFRHAGDRALVLFLDGHTEMLTREELRNERLWKNSPDSSLAVQ
jgi:prepilin-type N-terminal cleavage/methylation domain-containing protein